MCKHIVTQSKQHFKTVMSICMRRGVKNNILIYIHACAKDLCKVLLYLRSFIMKC